MSKLGDSLLETHKIITEERLDSYGKPEDCFSIIAELWNSYLIAREKIILYWTTDRWLFVIDL